MLATIYNVAVDLPIQESAWWVSFLWLCRCLYLFSYIRCYCCGGGGCPCADCSGGTGPCEYQVVIPALTNNGCANCADYSGTFVVDESNIGGLGAVGVDCIKTYDFDPPTCTYTSTGAKNMDLLYFGLFFISPNYFGQVGFTNTVPDPSAKANIWTTSFGATPPDCSVFVDEEIGTLSSASSSACTNGSNPLVTSL